MSPIWPYPGARVLSTYRLTVPYDTPRNPYGTVVRVWPGALVEVAFRGERCPSGVFPNHLRPAPGLRIVRARRRRR